MLEPPGMWSAVSTIMEKIYCKPNHIAYDRVLWVKEYFIHTVMLTLSFFQLFRCPRMQRESTEHATHWLGTQRQVSTPCKFSNLVVLDIFLLGDLVFITSYPTDVACNYVTDDARRLIYR